MAPASEARRRGRRAHTAPPRRDLEDALIYCDMTTGPDGQALDVGARLADIHARYGSGDLVSRSIRRASPRLIEAVATVRAMAADRPYGVTVDTGPYPR